MMKAGSNRWRWRCGHACQHHIFYLSSVAINNTPTLLRQQSRYYHGGDRQDENCQEQECQFAVVCSYIQKGATLFTAPTRCATLIRTIISTVRIFNGRRQVGAESCRMAMSMMLVRFVADHWCHIRSGIGRIRGNGSRLGSDSL